MPGSESRKSLAVLLVVYGAASLVHFIHNAEFLRDYPGLPQTWTRAGVYGVWLAMTAVGVAGSRGRQGPPICFLWDGKSLTGWYQKSAVRNVR